VKYEFKRESAFILKHIEKKWELAALRVDGKKKLLFHPLT
jgi:hypothetical protein